MQAALICVLASADPNAITRPRRSPGSPPFTGTSRLWFCGPGQVARPGHRLGLGWWPGPALCLYLYLYLYLSVYYLYLFKAYSNYGGAVQRAALSVTQALIRAGGLVSATSPRAGGSLIRVQRPGPPGPAAASLSHGIISPAGPGLRVACRARQGSLAGRRH
jgi:hypothetical protein